MSAPVDSMTPLFPLRLSDFEHYMLSDDRPSHPMVFVMFLEIVGNLQRDEFIAAVAELLSHQPLLRSTVTRIKGDWHWQPIASFDATACLDWQSRPEAEVRDWSPHVLAIDLMQSCGIRIEVRHASTLSRIALHLHHACCDGLAALQLVGELFAHYGQRTIQPGEKSPHVDGPNPELLRLRENYDAGEASVNRGRRSLGRTIGKISRLLLRRPVLLSESKDRPAPATRSPAILSSILPRETHVALRNVATSFGVSLNDLLIRELLILIRSWNRRAGRDQSSAWIRLGIPLSMRTTRHTNIPACNIVSYALVTRRAAECDEPEQLLRSIHQQTSDVLFNREGLVCLKLFRLLRKIPGGMRAFLSFKSCLSTLVFANVGDVRRRFSGRLPLRDGKWVAGNVVIENLYGVAPVRPRTHASFSIGDYAGALSISLRTDPAVLHEEDSRNLLQAFCNRLEQLASARNR